ncbi:hypothetical protein KAF25_007941 [Fusarium avenaceum]|uniref:DNA2/NAM7 helicase-like C-terminal domain-containing protein n=1 Tax=Fusarium avenaceum TaxID=40199 RepID=A0A9P7GX70_9HYPO|nr:hypothetical protein KAF25_007941 [Fusarium avenaceum]
MSAPAKGSKGTASTAGPAANNVGKGGIDSRQGVRTFVKDCAILLGDCGPVFACGKSLSHTTNTKLEAQFGLFKPADADPWLGFLIKIPLGPEQAANEAAGFGVCHAYRQQDESVLATDQYTIEIRFPRSSFQHRYEAAPEKLVSQFPDAKNLSYLTISFNDTKPVVIGYGRPFANVKDPQVESWVNGNQPLLNDCDCTLLDVLQLEKYHAIIPIKVSDAQKNLDPDRLPPAFSFPYGSQGWNVKAMKADIAANPGHRFNPTYVHPNNDSLMVAMTQPVVQDVMWLDDAVWKMYAIKVPGYFVPAPKADQYYVVVALPDEFMSEFEAAWRRLTKNTPAFNLHIYNSKNSMDPSADWDCQIMSHPANIDELSNHQIQDHELVLLVRRPDALEYRNDKLRGSDHPDWLSLEFDAGLMEAERQVRSISRFDADARPSSLQGTDLPVDPQTNDIADDLTPEQYKVLEELCDRMSLHRDIMRGAGFFDWMTAKAPKVPAWAAAKSSAKVTTKAPVDEASNDLAQVVEDIGNIGLKPKGTSLRPLPAVNFLDIEDQAYADCILEEALPEDRARFREYLSNRPLGLGMITAGAGFGKTTAGAAATLAMQAKLGKILCSGPTNVAIDNFAARLARRDEATIDRYNKGKAAADPSRRRYKLIIRGYNPSQEISAITSLLRDPKCGDDAVPPSSWKLPPRWKLNLSCAFWLLLVLRSPASGRQLRPDDHPYLHALQKRIDARPDLLPLRQIATGAITWEEYKTTVKDYALFVEDIQSLLAPIVENAEFLCITPAASENCKPFFNWKIKNACGIAIDEAACLSRGDLGCVWGNTLLPCFLFGDPRQLPPTVMTMTDKVPNTDHYLNRFSNYGEISAMGALLASGLPVYRLKVQLRMAHGIFDIISKVIYPDVPFTYHASRAVSNPEFKVGHEIEAFFRGKFSDLRPAAEGTLQPIFVHCAGSRVFVDPKTGSKRSQHQVKVALDLLSEMVQTLNVNVHDVVVIAPYMANVNLINSMSKTYPSLANLKKATTIDSYQGQESIITFVVMGTAHPSPGPGFTSNKQRLNVLLTRQKCSLVIVGDINVALPFKAGKEPLFKVEDVAGDVAYVKSPALRQVHRQLKEAGRVVTVDVDKGKKAEGSGEKSEAA